jgi:hypothetical protein
MTLPHERANAVNRTREFLISLLDTKKTPRIPKSLRIQAAALLRHYPSGYDMETVHESFPTKTHPAR